MSAKKSTESYYALINHQTNNFALPLYREEEVVYEAFEEGDDGRLSKVIRKRMEKRGDGHVILEGSHHRKLITEPTRTVVNQATVDAFKENPVFLDLVMSGLIRIEPTDAPE